MSTSAKTVGAAPAGASDRQSAAKAVQQMFSEIAPRYDLLNHVLSCNVDRLWWRRTARVFHHTLAKPASRVLDLCCGTCDMTLALHRQGNPRRSLPILGVDFAHPMLQRGLRKTEGAPIRLLEADALQLPISSGSLDLVVSAFGIRNLADYDAGLVEIFRVLAPGGEIGILDFSEPKGLLGQAYRVYFKHVLPKIGSVISGVRGPYAYLPASVARFPEPPEMLERMQRAGFKQVSWTPYTFGVAGLFRGTKSIT